MPEHYLAGTWPPAARLTGPVLVRRAGPSDQADIVALVRGEHLNPNGLEWPRFLVATDSRGLAGAVQLRHHVDGSFELGSLVVRQDVRLRGVAEMMIDTLLGEERRPVHAVTRRELVPFFARWGFVPVKRSRASAAVRRNHLIGSLMCVLAWLKGRRGHRLVILGRRAAPERTQYVARPPERSNTAPVLKAHSSEASQHTIAAASSTSRKRPIGIFDSM